MNKKNRTGIIGLLIVALGVLIAVYPLLTNRQYNAQVESRYEQFPHQSVGNETTEVMVDPLLEELYEKLSLENKKLSEQNQPDLTDPWSYEATEVDLTEYGLEDNIIAYLTIEKMDIKLPVLLGASRKNMKLGAAHMTNTSYPIGGEDTNCVIAAHRGYYKAELFRHIEDLDIGDEVILENFMETLKYRVAEIQVVDPNEAAPLFIQKGRELLTLLTCHPLGGDAQRYIVICERVK